MRSVHLVFAVLLAACTTDNPASKGDAGRDAAVVAPDAGPLDPGCPAGAACDDGDPCTDGDRCARGVCAGDPRDCADDEACTTDLCDPATGTCLHDRTPTGEREGEPGEAACADGDDDDCDGDVDAADLDCRRCAADAECADPDPCAVERCVDGRCEAQAVDVAPPVCDDGDPCTDGDRCVEGRCAGEPFACPAVDDPCQAPACDANGCGAAPLLDGTFCDDGDGCTADDACLAGRCGGRPRDCTRLDGPCVLGVCGGGGECRAVPRSDGVPCDQDACDGGAVCVAGECAGERVDCGHLEGECRVGVCDAETGGCTASAAAPGTNCDDGDPCTTDDQCGPAGCAGAARDCGGAGACGAARCDPDSGECVVDAAPNGDPCDDGEGCTLDDRCVDGECVGTARVCETRATCRVARCEGAECAEAKADDGAPCDDGDFCTAGDACADGECVGEAVGCDDADACTADRCGARGVCENERIPRGAGEGAPGSAACSNGADDDCDGRTDLGDPDCRACVESAECADDDPCTELVCEGGHCALIPGAADGRGCDDGDACTVADACRADTCRGTAMSCEELDGPCLVGVCDGGACRPRPRADALPCDDRDGCTVNDACLAGVCAGAARSCSGLDGECQVGRCAEGECRATPRNDGAPCNDADRCSQGDTCTGGRCGGRAPDCGALDSACVVGRCDPNSGACAGENRPDGSGCDDGDPCTVEDACAVGACVGRPRDCTALDGACVVGRCEAGECRATPRRDGTPCDDGSLCTAMDACAGGGCSGAARDCSELDGDCTVGVCDPASGRCAPEPTAQGMPCEDGVPCTAGDHCSEGRCAGVAVDCVRLHRACARGVCDPESGECEAQPVEDGALCDDGQACTAGDACRGGECGGAGLDCRGLDEPCVAGQCDVASGECITVPVGDGLPCDPGDLCVVGATCRAGECAGQPRDCSALGGACVVGACDPATGACQAARRPDGSMCDDARLCTVEDACDAGRCLGRARSCAHLDGPCVVGQCDAVRGCVAMPRANGTACDTGNNCLIQEACRDGQCAGAPLQCPDNDPNPCRGSACNPANGRCEPANAADGSGCNDNLFCTVEDVCRAGVCGGAQRNCVPGVDPCRVWQCNEGRDRCESDDVDDNTACEDGLYCTINDRCRKGVCRPRDDRECPDGNGGCQDGVCDEGADRCAQIARADGTFCFDGAVCTFPDRCRAGQCAPGDDVCD